MRCHEARQRLSELRNSGSDSCDHKDLIDHLNNCHNCAAFARAEQALIRDLQLIAAEEHEEVRSFDSVRKQVEFSVDQPGQQSPMETTFVSKLARNITGSPKIGFSILTVAAIVVLFTLIPFKYQETVGYEVAVAGVDKNVALDASSMHQLLVALGLPQADFDVVNCDTTCLVKISELKSEGDIKLVRAAFDNMGNAVCGEAQTVFVQKSGTLVDCLSANNDAHFSNLTAVDEETNHFVMECLDSLACDTGVFSVFLSKCGTGNATVDFTFDGDNADFSGSPENVFVQVGCDEMPGANMTACSVVVCIPADSAHCAKMCEKHDDGAAKEEPSETLPSEFGLNQNYPNPFNPSTEISFSLRSAENVKLEIFNVQGRKVRTLIEAPMAAGEHTIQWDGRSESGNRVASGVYMYRLQAGEFTDSKKMTLVK